MSDSTIPMHRFERPKPGHVDGPNACRDCGHDPLAAHHAEPDAHLRDRIEAAHEAGLQLRTELARMTGTDSGHFDHVLAFADGHVARLLAALDGDTRPAPFLVAARRPSVTQHTLPLTA